MRRVCISLLTVLLILSACADKNTQPETKNITVSVIADKTEKFEIETEKEFLGEALKEKNLIEGEEGQYGIFITSVNGIKANEENKEWWCLTKNNESVMTGADMTKIYDGDKFELTLKRGY